MGISRKKLYLKGSLSRLDFFFIPNAKPWDKFDLSNSDIGDSGESLKRYSGKKYVSY
jgi:hypothetical protein